MLHEICTAVFLVNLAATALAIHCYSCESVYETNCGEDFEMQNYFKLDCSRLSPPRYLENDLDARNATACMKRIYRARGVQEIERSCFFGDVNDTVSGCQMDPTLDEVKAIACHVCDNENFCNHSVQLKTWPHYMVSVWLASMAHRLQWLS